MKPLIASEITVFVYIIYVCALCIFIMCIYKYTHACVCVYIYIYMVRVRCVHSSFDSELKNKKSNYDDFIHFSLLK